MANTCTMHIHTQACIHRHCVVFRKISYPTQADERKADKIHWQMRGKHSHGVRGKWSACRTRGKENNDRAHHTKPFRWMDRTVVVHDGDSMSISTMVRGSIVCMKNVNGKRTRWTRVWHTTVVVMCKLHSFHPIETDAKCLLRACVLQFVFFFPFDDQADVDNDDDDDDDNDGGLHDEHLWQKKCFRMVHAACLFSTQRFVLMLFIRFYCTHARTNMLELYVYVCLWCACVCEWSCVYVIVWMGVFRTYLLHSTIAGSRCLWQQRPQPHDIDGNIVDKDKFRRPPQHIPYGRDGLTVRWALMPIHGN